MRKNKFLLKLPQGRVTFIVCTLLIGGYAALLRLDPERRLQSVLSAGVRDRVDYRFILATLVHVRLRHLLFNLAGIVLLGSWLESRLNRLVYLVSILIGTWAGWAFYLLRQPIQPAVGASGLLFSLLGLCSGLQNKTVWLAALLSGLAWLGIACMNYLPGPADIHASSFLVGCLISRISCRARLAQLYVPVWTQVRKI
jgi:membrane associated rhomboid family serine protease